MPRILLFIFLSLAFTLSIPSTALAHVLITDSRGSIGAIFHVNPDDDPVAGQPAVLSLSLQSMFGSSLPSSGTLAIIDDKGIRDTVNARVSGSSLLYTYAFPRQGVYALHFVVTAGSGELMFDQSQLVSRGTEGSGMQATEHPAAEAIAGTSALLIVLLLIFCITRWRKIRERSLKR